MAAEAKRDLIADAKNFCDGLSNVFMMKKRDPQTKHLLEKSKMLIEALIVQHQKPVPKPKPNLNSSVAKTRSAGGMGQLWVQLEDMKKENEFLKRKFDRSVSHDEKTVAKLQQQESNDAMVADLGKTKRDNEALAVDVERLVNEIKDLHFVNRNIQDEYKRVKILLETKQSDLERSARDCKSMESKLNSTETENDNLKQRLVKSVAPMVRVPESNNVENISDKCRPSTLAIRYNALESQEWVDAKEALEDLDTFAEEEITQFLCAALTKSYAVSEGLCQQVEISVLEMINNPGFCLQFPSQAEASSKELPDDVNCVLHKYMRLGCQEVDVECIRQETEEVLTEEFESIMREHVTRLKPVSIYLRECARITWQMIVQQPPMFICTDDTQFNSDKHKLWWSCDTNNAQNIDYFIWPVLHEHQGGTMLVKGCVHTT